MFRKLANHFAALVPGVLLATSLVSASTADLRPELEVKGRVTEVTLSPAGHIWIGTAMARVYVSRDWNISWSEVEVPSRRDPRSFRYDYVDRITFFDDRHAIMTGYLGQSQNLIYRTEDGGASWSPVTIPASLWIYDAQVTSDGLGWLVGSSGDLLFTEDFGASWERRKAPFDSTLRSHSVHFVSRSLGVVGSLDERIKYTRNGGRSWKRLKSPVETGLTSCENVRVRILRLLDNQVVVNMCGSTYYRPLRGKDAWMELRSGDESLLFFEVTMDGIIAVTCEEYRIVEFSGDLQTSEDTGAQLQTFPLDIAVHDEQIVFIDGDYKISTLDPTGFRSSRMFAQGPAMHWPIKARDRGAGDVFWGISRYFLYRSPDHGETWERQAELDRTVGDLAIQASGDVLIWNRHGYVARWLPTANRLADVPDLEGLDIVGLFRRGDLWIAYGGMQYETERRIEIARTFFSGQFAGSVDHGWVAASTDGGSTWSVVDSWDDAGVQAIFLSDQNTLTLLSWLGAVRRGRLTLSGDQRPQAEMQTILPATDDTHNLVPYVERAHLLDFIKEDEGWIKGWIHHMGNFLFRTTDGGLTWTKTDIDARQPDRIYRLGKGDWIGVANGSDVLILIEDKFELMKHFAEPIDWILVDATGQLILGLESGEIWALSADAKEWSLL